MSNTAYPSPDDTSPSGVGSNELLKEHYDMKAKLMADIARLQQAGEDRDKRIDKIDASIESLKKDVNSIRNLIYWAMGVAAVFGFFMTSLGQKILAILKL